MNDGRCIYPQLRVTRNDDDDNDDIKDIHFVTNKGAYSAFKKPTIRRANNPRRVKSYTTLRSFPTTLDSTIDRSMDDRSIHDPTTHRPTDPSTYRPIDPSTAVSGSILLFF